MRNLILMLFLSVAMVACNKKKEAPVVDASGIDLQAIGTSNFGGVLISQYKDAAIKLTNNNATEVLLDFSKITSPFSIQSKSAGCLSNKLIGKDSCVITVRFSPTVAGSFSSSLKQISSLINGDLIVQGLGLESGYLTIDSSVWNLGTLIAGTLKTKDIIITNNGDSTVSFPVFNFPNKISIGLNQCGLYISPKTSCLVRLESRLEIAQDYSYQLTGVSPEGGTIVVNYSSKIIPNVASGLITFQSVPASMSSAGEEFVIVTQPIKDSFGNVVPSGTSVSVNGNSLLLLIDGNVYTTNSIGVVQFRVRTRTIKGIGSVSITTGQASGYSTFPILSGTAFGEIATISVLNEIPANGISQVIINTDLIKDQYGNIVEDGTKVYFEITGSANLTYDLEPKKYETFTISGVAKAIVTAGTVAELSTLSIKSGQVKDVLGNVIGYAANGSVNLQFIPGVANGIIPVLKSTDIIFADSNVPTDVLLPFKSKITFGPLKDQYGNIVKVGSEVTVSLVNAWNSSAGFLLSNFILNTDSLGMASFDLTGKGVRGDISVAAEAAFASGTTSLWAVYKSKTVHEKNNSKVSMYFKHHDANSLPDAIPSWAKMKNIDNMDSQDQVFIGYKKHSSEPQSIYNFLQGIPYFYWKCFYSAGEMVISNFCMQPDGLLSPVIKYDKQNNVTQDFPEYNPSPELNNNVDFRLGIDGWSYPSGGTSRINNQDTGFTFNYQSTARWNSDNFGTIEIDNSQLSTVISEQLGNKNAAISSWMPVSDLKKYALVFTIANQFGINNDAKSVQVGIAETSTVLDLASAAEYVMDMREIGSGFLSPNAYTRTVYRIVYTPKSGTKYVRLYFSTQGTGYQTKVRIDDISFKLLYTQSLHDSSVTQYPTIGYMPSSDTLLLFGGNSLINNGIAPDNSYSGYSSNRTSLFSKMLDKSSSVVTETYDTQEKISSLGSIPSGRGYMPLVGVNSGVYGFGGFSNIGDDGSTSNSLVYFDGAQKIWMTKEIEGDLVLPAAEKKPLGRYQHGMVYVPELNSIYMGGGIAQNPDDAEVWTSQDDLWKIDLSQSNLHWNRICNGCGFFTNFIYQNFTALQRFLYNFGSNPTYFNNYSNAIRNPKEIDMVWHSATQKMYIHSPESTGLMKIFDPFLNTISNAIGKGIPEMQNAFQIVYNDYIGRVYSYVRGTTALNDSKVYYWDMNIDEKQYLKARFQYDLKAKTTLKKIKFSMYAYGQSVTIRDYDLIKNDGVDVYIYNFRTNAWVASGANLAASADQISGSIDFTFASGSVIDYVSASGYVELLVGVRGRPGIEGSESLMGDSLLAVDLVNNESTSLNYNVKEISMGGGSSFVILGNDKLYGFGRNEYGQLGLENMITTVGGYSNSMGENMEEISLFDPNNVNNAGLKVSKVYSGMYHSCALLSNGRAKCWGRNQYGQLGYSNSGLSRQSYGDEINEMSDSLPYLNVGTIDGTNSTNQLPIIKLVLGNSHTCALLQQNNINRVKCWGKKDEGQIGLGSFTGAYDLLAGNSTSFVSYPGISTILDTTTNAQRERSVLDLVSGNNFNCAVLEGPLMYCWGENSKGQLGKGNTSNASLPGITNIQFTNIAQVVAGDSHICMYYENGSGSGFNTKCWGNNSDGQIGIENTNNIGDSSGEVESSAYVNWGLGLYPTKLMLGTNYTCALLNNQRVKCFGSNYDGILGLGYGVANKGSANNEMGDFLPYVNLGLNGSNQPLTVTQLISGFSSNSACAIMSNGDLKCWGNNDYGQLGLQDKRNRGKGYPSSKGTTEIMIDYIESEETY